MSTEDESLLDFDEMICPGCMQLLEGEPYFCPHCNAPIAGIVCYDPLKHIYAQAYMFRRGVERPTSALILFGVVAIFGVIFCASPLYLMFVFADLWSLDFFTGAVTGAITAAVGITATVKCLRNYVRIRIARNGQEPADVDAPG